MQRLLINHIGHGSASSTWSGIYDIRIHWEAKEQISITNINAGDKLPKIVIITWWAYTPPH